MRRAVRFLTALPLLLLSPLPVAAAAIVLYATDLLWLMIGRRRRRADTIPDRTAASVVIPNWNGRDLLEKYLPSVIEAMRSDRRNEIIVVDNGSHDGSAEFIRSRFPEVRLLALPANEGFGGGSNAGFRAAKNDIVILLNSDMRVAPDFLAPLLEGFTDERVFAVACQIFFSDQRKVREETGLTQASWRYGRLNVRHRDDPGVKDLYPCFYGGGGSCAFDRRKFLELGGFDRILEPFYLEDTDLGYMAWKRGWKVFYQPRSVVFHEHRGTIGRTFSASQIQAVLKKNFVLFAWKNIHEPRKLGSHLCFSWIDCMLSLIFGDSPERANSAGLWRAALQLGPAAVARWKARSLSEICDEEAFKRPLGGYFRDRFGSLPASPERLSVLFVSPYPICPPVHGGAVFMSQTASLLAGMTDLHLIVLLDSPAERAPHTALGDRAKSLEFLVRMTGVTHTFGAITPHAIDEFRNPDLEWLIHRQIYTKKVDAVQLEYLPMGQYGGSFQRLATMLFEHDVYFQSVGRQLRGMHGILVQTKARLEYLRALRYELSVLTRFDRVQVCSRENGDFLASFAPGLQPRIDSDLRAGIDTSRYSFQADGREPLTMLFLGSFRHLPNREAIDWFLRHVLPHVRRAEPAARLVVVGSDPPPLHSLPERGCSVELRGFVEDVREPLRRYSVFVCPILSGSGMRVKLLEAFASGIPVVSTWVGAEGLAEADGELCALADDPRDFAGKTVELLRNPQKAAELAARARQAAVERLDMRPMTRRLVENYRRTVEEKRTGATFS